MTTTDPLGEAGSETIKLRNQVLVRNRPGWTRQEWIDEARDLMEDPHGSVAALLEGHVLALLSNATNVEDQVAAGYAEGFADGRWSFRAAALRMFDDLLS